MPKLTQPGRGRAGSLRETEAPCSKLGHSGGRTALYQGDRGESSLRWGGGTGLSSTEQYSANSVPQRPGATQKGLRGCHGTNQSLGTALRPPSDFTKRQSSNHRREELRGRWGQAEGAPEGDLRQNWGPRTLSASRFALQTRASFLLAQSAGSPDPTPQGMTRSLRGHFASALGTAPRQQPHLGPLHGKFSSLVSPGTRVQ